MGAPHEQHRPTTHRGRQGHRSTRLTFTGIEWKPPADTTTVVPALFDQADVMHALLVLRADKLDGCVEGSEEVTELRMLTEVVTAYEEKRWPDGKVPGGKG